jgi:hypothetical protein
VLFLGWLGKELQVDVGLGASHEPAARHETR